MSLKVWFTLRNLGWRPYSHLMEIMESRAEAGFKRAILPPIFCLLVALALCLPPAALAMVWATENGRTFAPVHVMLRLDSTKCLQCVRHSVLVLLESPGCATTPQRQVERHVEQNAAENEGSVPWAPPAHAQRR